MESGGGGLCRDEWRGESGYEADGTRGRGRGRRDEWRVADVERKPTSLLEPKEHPSRHVCPGRPSCTRSQRPFGTSFVWSVGSRSLESPRVTPVETSGTCGSSREGHTRRSPWRPTRTGQSCT